MIREMNVSEIEEVSELIREVFNDFVGSGYSEEGNQTFFDYIAQSSMKTRQTNDYLTLINIDKEKINGIIELRNNNHISLFFVKSDKHNQGIGKKLLAEAINRVKSLTSYLEVNASPYSVKIYKKLGFIQQKEMQENNGIKYVPMLMKLNPEG